MLHRRYKGAKKCNTMKDGNYDFSAPGHAPGHAPGNRKAKAKKGASLDTLAQLGTRLEKQGKDKVEDNPLKKRARAKHYGVAVATQLTLLSSPLEKSYRNSIYCASVLEQDGAKFTGRYCKARWCPVCNRIRTAKLIHGYAAPLAALEDSHFVTLTIPNVPAADLRAAIDYMLVTVKRFQEAYKKRFQRRQQNWQLKGLRKLECTHNAREDTFHPHFHFIVEGEAAARALVADWLQALPDASYKAQKAQKAYEGANHELFKYFTKLVTKQPDGRRVTDTRALDIIFQAMQGRRVFQPIGIRMVSEDIEELQAVETDAQPAGNALWQWFGTDWANVETGECLTGYIPSRAMEQLVSDIL